MAIPGFLFGGDTGLTQEQLGQRRRIMEAMLARGIGAPRNIGEGLVSVGNALAYRMEKNALAKGEAAATERRNGIIAPLFGGVGQDAPTGAGTASTAGNVASTGEPVDMTGNEVFSNFMDTVGQEVKNPYALAAIAATGNAESKFSPGNVNRTWSDPSQSGQPGTAGGIMSWRGPRYEALAATGDLSPTGQAKFFLQEDPQLIKALNSAGSLEEAQSLMNNAWKFAGYDQPGGEAANRLGYAKSFLSRFQGGGAPNEVASLDPGVGMPAMTAADAIEEQAPAAGSLSDEVADFQQTPEYAAQFPGRAAVAKAVAEKPGAMPQQQFSPAVMTVGNALAAKAQPQPQEGVQAPAQMPMQMAQAADTGPSLQQLYQAAASPDITDTDRAVIGQMLQQKLAQQQASQEQQVWLQRQGYQRQLDQNDPLYQLKLQAAQRELDQGKTQPLINAGAGQIYDPNKKEWLTPPGKQGEGGAFRFGGNSVEAQSLNGLMDSGQLTPEQAQQLGAGKTITGRTAKSSSSPRKASSDRRPVVSLSHYRVHRLRTALISACRRSRMKASSSRRRRFTRRGRRARCRIIGISRSPNQK